MFKFEVKDVVQNYDVEVTLPNGDKGIVTLGVGPQKYNDIGQSMKWLIDHELFNDKKVGGSAAMYFQLILRIVSWGIIDKEDKPLECSTENKQFFFGEYPTALQNLQMQIIERDLELSKNSEASQAGAETTSATSAEMDTKA
jgi:hypothetical protein